MAQPCSAGLWQSVRRKWPSLPGSAEETTLVSECFLFGGSGGEGAEARRRREGRRGTPADCPPLSHRTAYEALGLPISGQKYWWRAASVADPPEG